MVRKSKHDNSVRLRAIHDSKRKILDEDLSGILGRTRSRERKRHGPSGCLFHRCRKTGAQTSLLSIVLDHLGQELLPCGCEKPSASHRDKRRASAKTSSAA